MLNSQLRMQAQNRPTFTALRFFAKFTPLFASFFPHQGAWPQAMWPGNRRVEVPLLYLITVV